MSEHPIRRQLIEECTQAVADVLHMDMKGCKPWMIQRALEQVSHDYGLKPDAEHSYQFWSESLRRTLSEKQMVATLRGVDRKEASKRFRTAIEDTARAIVTMHWLT